MLLADLTHNKKVLQAEMQYDSVTPETTQKIKEYQKR